MNRTAGQAILIMVSAVIAGLVQVLYRPPAIDSYLSGWPYIFRAIEPLGQAPPQFSIFSLSVNILIVGCLAYGLLWFALRRVGALKEAAISEQSVRWLLVVPLAAVGLEMGLRVGHFVWSFLNKCWPDSGLVDLLSTPITSLAAVVAFIGAGVLVAPGRRAMVGGTLLGVFCLTFVFHQVVAVAVALSAEATALLCQRYLSGNSGV